MLRVYVATALTAALVSTGACAFELTSPDVAPGAKAIARLTMIGRDAAVYGRVLRDQYRVDLAGAETDTFVARQRGR